MRQVSLAALDSERVAYLQAQSPHPRIPHAAPAKNARALIDLSSASVTLRGLMPYFVAMPQTLPLTAWNNRLTHFCCPLTRTAPATLPRWDWIGALHLAHPRPIPHPACPGSSADSPLPC